MIEEKIEFNLAKNVFYNPEMQFCRSFCSLAVGAIGNKINILDAFSASGIRGIRYAKENKNVASIGFLEANDCAIPVIKKNLKESKIKKSSIIKKLYEKYFTSPIGLRANSLEVSKISSDFFFYDFIEIDPFGTPTPFLWSTFYGQVKKKEFYLSATATDTAVLCGPETKACRKNYHSKSLNNEFTHENGTRILIKRIMETANEFDFGATPIFSLSDRHYIKVLLKIEKGAEKAYRNIEKFGFVSYCNKCGWRTAGKRMQNQCKSCKNITDYAGPLWLGELHDKKFLNKMLMLNKKRDYEHIEEIEKKIKLMLGELAMPPYFYDLHVTCKRIKASVPKIDDVIKKLKGRGFRAARTHFAKNGIKTNADMKELKKAIV